MSACVGWGDDGKGREAASSEHVIRGRLKELLIEGDGRSPSVAPTEGIIGSGGTILGDGGRGAGDQGTEER